MPFLEFFIINFVIGIRSKRHLFHYNSQRYGTHFDIVFNTIFRRIRIPMLRKDDIASFRNFFGCRRRIVGRYRCCPRHILCIGTCRFSYKFGSFDRSFRDTLCDTRPSLTKHNRRTTDRGGNAHYKPHNSLSFLLSLTQRTLNPRRTVPHPPAPSRAPPDLHGCRILLRISNFYVPSALFQDNFVSLLNNSFMGSLEVFAQCRPDRRLCSSRAR